MVEETLRRNESRAGTGWAWRRLAVGAAVIATVAHLIVGAAYRDLDAFGVAVFLAIGLGLTRLRNRRWVWVVLGVAFANVAFWTVPATFVNVAGSFGFAAIAVPGVMAVLGLAGLVATVGTLTSRRRGTLGEAAARRVSIGAVAALVVVLAIAAFGTDGRVTAQPGDIVITSDSTAFSPTEVVAQAGIIDVYLENRDYFWHTFTIRDLGVDLRVPVGAAGRVTFNAPPGVYEFVCAIPGHDFAGMVGTLTVLG